MNRHWMNLAHFLSENYFFHSRKKVGPFVHSTLCKRWYLTVVYRSWIDTRWTLYILCRKINFSQSEEGWTCCIPNVVQMLVLYSQLPGLDRHCTSTVGKLLFPQSEDGWTCCTPTVVQTLVFYSRLPELNRHRVDLAHLLSENYFFHSRKKVGPVVSPTLYKCWYFTVNYQG